MGIFGDDDRQNERLDALEAHIRSLTEEVQQNEADLMACTISILSLKAKVEGKVSASDVDPAIMELNQQLTAAREEVERTSAAASESWATLQAGVNESFETLRSSVQAASDRLFEA